MLGSDWPTFLCLIKLICLEIKLLIEVWTILLLQIEKTIIKISFFGRFSDFLYVFGGLECTAVITNSERDLKEWIGIIACDWFVLLIIMVYG